MFMYHLGGEVLAACIILNALLPAVNKGHLMPPNYLKILICSEKHTNSFTKIYFYYKNDLSGHAFEMRSWFDKSRFEYCAN